MDGPVIGWTRGGITVPELGLQEETTGIVEAASVGDGSLVVATQGVLEGTALFGEGENGAGEEKGAYGGREE